MKRLGILHTAPFLVEVFKKRLGARYPELDSFHVVDEGTIQSAQRSGGLTPDIIRRLGTQAALMQETGAEVILFTCSSTSPAVDQIRPLVNVPIVKIDDSMMAEAVNRATTIGLLCTSKTAMPCSSGLLRAHATEHDKNVTIIEALEAEAYGAGRAGDTETHDRLVKAKAADLARRCDLIVLGQASMAHLATELSETTGKPVLACLDLCVEGLAPLLTAA